MDNVDEVIAEETLTDIVMEDLTSEYDLIKYHAERDPDLGIPSTETTMRNMYSYTNIYIVRRIISSRSHGHDSSLLVTSLPNS